MRKTTRFALIGATALPLALSSAGLAFAGDAGYTEKDSHDDGGKSHHEDHKKGHDEDHKKGHDGHEWKHDDGKGKHEKKDKGGMLPMLPELPIELPGIPAP